MRLLVHEASLGAGICRMRLAAAGLELRGHEVFWGGTRRTGAATSDFLEVPAAGGEQSGSRSEDESSKPMRMPFWRAPRADIVLGGATPTRPAIAGWFSGARSMLLSFERGGGRRWGSWDRWCWGSLDSAALLEPGEEIAVPSEIADLDAERISRWSSDRPPARPDPSHPDTELLERECERLLARQRGRGVRPAAFLDRDGTLVVERGYSSETAGLELLPGVPEALRSLRAAGYALVVISNQSGVGRGLFSLVNVYETMARLRTVLRRQGVELDAVYFCPHRPDEGCDCRKPGAALLERAAGTLRVSLRHSVMIGDKMLDVEAGRKAGARGVLVRTGYGVEEERGLPADRTRRPDLVCDDLAGAVPWLLRQGDWKGLD